MRHFSKTIKKSVLLNGSVYSLIVIMEKTLDKYAAIINSFWSVFIKFCCFYIKL